MASNNTRPADPRVQVNSTASGRIYAFGWQGGFAMMVNMKVRSWAKYRWSAVVSYAWSPSHDQCGTLRPFGTSSADWW
jgi:hypothetical protein